MSEATRTVFTIFARCQGYIFNYVINYVPMMEYILVNFGKAKYISTIEIYELETFRGQFS